MSEDVQLRWGAGYREKIDLIRRVWQRGMSSTDIADAIVVETGETVSRNAIISVYHRRREDLQDYPLQRASSKGTTKFATPEHRQDAIRVSQRKFAAKRKLEKEQAIAAGTYQPRPRPEPIPAPISKIEDVKPPQLYPAEIQGDLAGYPRLLDLQPHQCRWAIGEDSMGHRFCGLDKRSAKGPYCQDHDARAFNPNFVRGTTGPKRRVQLIANPAKEGSHG